MADFDYNVYIKAHALQAIKEVRAFDSALERMQGTVKKVDASTRTVNKWVKQFEAVANPIEFAVQQMGRLNKELAKAKTVARVASIQKQQAGLIQATGMSQNFQNAYKQATAVRKAQEALEAFERRLDPTRQKLYELEQKLNDNREKFIELNSAGKNTAGVERSIKKIKNQMQKLEESTNKTSNRFKVLWGRIKNIAIYRTIRRSIQIIFQTITKGFERVTKLNKDAEKLALRLRVDYNLIATAIGVTLYTILKSFIGQVDSLTDTLINYINAFNRGIAVVSGQDKYLKVVRKDIDSINKSLNNLSFDKFEALSKGNEDTNGVGLVETLVGNTPTDTEKKMLSVVEVLRGAFEAIRPILKDVLWVMGQIFSILFKILGTGIIQWLTDVIAKIVEILDKVGLLKGVLVGLLTLGIISKIKLIASGVNTLTLAIAEFVAVFTIVRTLLDKLPAKTRIYVGALVALVGAFLALFVAIQMLRSAWTGFGAIAVGVAAGAAAIAGIAGIVSGSKELNIGGYAEGGIPDKSELFYMNENGVPEALVNTGGSQTNVINIDQLSEGMRRGFVQAIYDTGLIDAMETRLVVDGSSVNDNAFARAIFPALKTESRRRGGNQL